MDEAKNDITSLFQIYGAIDQDVKYREDLQRLDSEEEHPVALLLPMYKQPGRHWFEQYVEATGSLETLNVDLDDRIGIARMALSALAETKPRCRMQARRLFAVGGLARTFPDLAPEDLASAVLGRRQFELLDEPAKQAEELAQLFLRTPDIADADAALDVWWDGLFASSALPRQDVVGPRPCAAGLRMVTLHGDPDPVPTLKTVFDAPIAFEAAIRFCDPLTWKCFPNWCSMEKWKNGTWSKTNGGDQDWEENGVPKIRKYRERVSFDCIGKTMPELTVELDFTKRKYEGPPRVAIAEYRLSDHPQVPQHDVLVNEGWLEIRELSPEPPMVRVTTTKSIKFRPAYGGPWLALISCHVGYLSMVEDLVCCASKAPPKDGEEDEGYPDIPFPGQAPPKAEARRSMRGAEPAYGGLITVMVDEAGDAVEECIDEFAEAAKASYDKIEAKSYRADELVRDIADYWVRMLGKGARVADASRKAVEAASRGEERPAARTRRRMRAEL